MPTKNRLSFEDCIDIINSEIAKKRGKWTLTSLSYLDYDDVSQIIRIHIWKKWHLYDQTKPLVPWLSIVISHQIRNLIRNHYSNYSRPCVKCDASEGSDGCKIYNIQCAQCPLYADWEKKKRPAQLIKMPVPIDNHSNEISEIPEETNTLSEDLASLHVQMKKILKPTEYIVYEGLFILHESEEIIAKKAGFISNEKGRAAGYRQIINIRNSIIDKIKKYIKSGGIEI